MTDSNDPATTTYLSDFFKQLDANVSIWFDWVSVNPIFSAFIAALLFIASGLAAWVVDKFADTAWDSFQKRRQRKREVFDEVTSILIPNRTNEAVNNLSSHDLIEFYQENEVPYSIDIAGTIWQFAGTRVIDPVGIGRIDDQNISMKYHDVYYQMNDELAALTADRLEALEKAPKSERLFDGSPFCISQLTLKGEKTIIEVERCRYFESLRTNFSMDLVLPSTGKSLREMYHGKSRRFEPLGSSPFPNHMGLVVIIETRDGRIVVQQRSKDVEIRPGTLSASVSGTFEDDDLNRGPRAFPFKSALKGLLRELHAELGGTYASNMDGLYFTGLIREFRRGGFPDFYFYYQSPYSFDEIRKNSKTAREVFEINDLNGHYVGSRELFEDFDQALPVFSQRISDLLQKIEGKANLTLSLGIALYFEMMCKRASAEQSNS